MTVFVFCLFLIVYFFIHSFLAVEKIKKWFQKKIIAEKYYRLFYNSVAILVFFILAYFYFILEKKLLFEIFWIKLVGVIISLLGLYWVALALKGYDLGEFSGLDQIGNKRTNKEVGLKTDGLNARVRHPLYFGTLLVVWGVFLYFPFDAALSVSAITTIYIYIGTLLEEKKLAQHFGEAYRSYQRRVPMLLPRW